MRAILGLLIGGAVGFAYYRLVGCRSGACPLSGNPFVATGYGALIGLLLGLA